MKLGKKLEHLIKNSIAALLRVILEQQAEIPKPPYKRILFLRFDALGDMILSFPVYRAARQAVPTAEIDVLCSPKNVILLQGTGLADNLLIAAKNPLDLLKLIIHIRKRDYDLIINLVTRPSFTFGLVARLGGPRSVRIAGDQEKFSYFYNRNIQLPPKSDIHMMTRKFLVCGDFMSTNISHIDTPWVTYPIEIKEESQSLLDKVLNELNCKEGSKSLAAINLSAGLSRREWSVEKYAKFINQQISKYEGIIDGWVVFDDPAKPDKTKQLIALLKARGDQGKSNSQGRKEINNLTILPAQSDFRVIMEFLSLVTVLITPDTSIAHAASAMGTPVLVLTIGENMTVWDPVGVPYKIVFSEDLYSLETLPVEDVVDGFESLMAMIKT